MDCKLPSVSLNHSQGAVPMADPRQCRTTIHIWAALLSGALAIQAWAAPAEYFVVPAQSELVVRVYKGGPAARLAHDHVIRATRFTGIFTGDPAQPMVATGSLTVETASLQADEPELRQKYGLSQELSAADRQQIESTMLGKGQLEATQYRPSTSD
jgi:polyisoprenoid-binding protein YceI